MYNMLNSLLKADDRNILEQLPPLSCQPPKNFEMNILREVCEILHPISLFTNEMQATHAGNYPGAPDAPFGVSFQEKK